MTQSYNGSNAQDDRIGRWMVQHWLFLFNFFVGIYVALPILAPVMMEQGWTKPARLIYTVYKPTCHQMVFRSFFLFGEQPVYPRTIVNSNYKSFEAYASALPEFAGVDLDHLTPPLINAARQFLGNPVMGYKVAICERDLGIFGFLLIGGLLYGVLRRFRKIAPLPLWAFILLGMGPIALDGFSQLFGNYGEILSFLKFIPVRESSPLLRTATGAWFGLCIAWIALPYIDMGMRGE